MEIIWLILAIGLIYGFFLARYFYFFHNVLPKKYGLFIKNVISHTVLIAVFIMIVLLMRFG